MVKGDDGHCPLSQLTKRGDILLDQGSDDQIGAVRHGLAVKVSNIRWLGGIKRGEGRAAVRVWEQGIELIDRAA